MLNVQCVFLGGNTANTVRAYHWVLVAFSTSGTVFFGDSLTASLPKNLRALVEPYYIARFPDTEMPGIYNCSVDQEFPNFPRQKTDGYLCGYICLLVMMASLNEQLTRCIFSKNKISSNMGLLKFPYKYPCFVRNLLQTIYCDKAISINHFLSNIDKNVLFKNSPLLLPGPKLQSIPRKHKDISPSGGDQHQFKKVSLRKKKTTVTADKKMNLKKENSDKNKERDIRNDEDTGNDEVIGNEHDYGKQNEHGEKEQESTNNHGEIILNKVYTFKRSHDLLDPYVWKCFGRRVKKKQYQTFRCAVDSCSAIKKVRTLGFSVSLIIQRYTPESNMETIYLTKHSCKNEEIKLNQNISVESEERAKPEHAKIPDKQEEAHNQSETIDKHEQFECLQCKVMFKRMSELRYHTILKHSSFMSKHMIQLDKLEISLSKLPFMSWCQQCDFLTNSVQELKDHQQTVHVENMDYSCTVCNFKTEKYRNFNDHMKFKHFIYEDKQSSCDYCDFGPSLPYYLDLHKRITHPAEFTCYHCGKCFINQFERNCENSQHKEFVKHLRSEHNLTNYFCCQCGYETDKIREFATHAHVQQMLLDDVEEIYPVIKDGNENLMKDRSESESDLNVSNSSKSTSDAFDNTKCIHQVRSILFRWAPFYINSAGVSGL